MTSIKSRLAVWTTLCVALAFGTPAGAQDFPAGRTAFENLGALRPPGAMVGAGLGRAAATANEARAQVLAPQITETSRPTSIRAQFLASAVGTVIDSLGQTFLFLGNRWLARIGLAPLLPPELFFPPTDSTDGEGGGLNLQDLLGQFTGGQDPSGSGSQGTGDGTRTGDRGGK